MIRHVLRHSLPSIVYSLTGAIGTTARVKPALDQSRVIITASASSVGYTSSLKLRVPDSR